jgi:hypothetical protein
VLILFMAIAHSQKGISHFAIPATRQSDRGIWQAAVVSPPLFVLIPGLFAVLDRQFLQPSNT